MGERTPSSDTRDQPRHERAVRRRVVSTHRATSADARSCAADLHCSALGDRLLEDVVPHLLRSFSQRAESQTRAQMRLGAQKAREFADALLDADEAAATRMVDELRTEGAVLRNSISACFRKAPGCSGITGKPTSCRSPR